MSCNEKDSKERQEREVVICNQKYYFTILGHFSSKFTAISQKYSISDNHIQIPVVHGFGRSTNNRIIIHPDHLMQVGRSKAALSKVSIKARMYFPPVVEGIQYNGTLAAFSCATATSQLLYLQLQVEAVSSQQLTVLLGQSMVGGCCCDFFSFHKIHNLQHLKTYLKR